MTIMFETLADQRRLSRAMRRSMRGDLRLYPILGAICLLLAVGDVVTGWSLVFVVTVALAVMFFAIPSLTVRTMVRAIAKTYGLPTTWTVDDEGVRMVNTAVDSLIRWPVFEAVDVLPDQVILQLDRRLVMPMPTDTLTSEQRRDLADALRQRGLLASQQAELTLTAA